MKKFLLAFLTIIALSGAVVMSHPSPALAFDSLLLVAAASSSREQRYAGEGLKFGIPIASSP
jgi:hypothetical protein